MSLGGLHSCFDIPLGIDGTGDKAAIIHPDFDRFAHSRAIDRFAGRGNDKPGPFGQDFDLESQRLYIQPSIGVAIYPEHGGEEHRLLGHADEAMYLSKRNGGNQVRVALAPLYA